MRRAIELAATAIREGTGGPFGAVVVRGDNVVAEAVNQVVQQRDPTAHAEVLAIRGACQKLGTFSLAGCELYCSCEPCPMCLSAIHWARLNRVSYGAGREDAARIGFDDDYIYRQLALQPQERELCSEQVLRDDAVRMMQAWLKVDPERHY
jgi:guanine deaminase